ncbi:hypothetical protein BZF66_05855 [Salmonella enterica]|nr:hypothetical protein CPT_Munch_009 [Salmonella phage Munch]EAZ2022817.1 hypothetical protein [Salmonella enterica]ECC6867389.1 hypothetical protein [Salmonella enterica]MCP0435955.1 hypothetical protein [Salmonella enterica subsp. enterica serovar Mbandaka]
MTRYTVEVCTTKNVVTDVIRYYKMICGVARRISKADYDKLDREADGLDCFYTVNTKTHTKQFKTLSYYM